MADTDTGKIGFEKDIKPLFREKDRESMHRSFDLWSYSDVVANAEPIAERLSDGSMPCDGAWPAEHVGLFRRWIDEGSAQ